MSTFFHNIDQIPEKELVPGFSARMVHTDEQTIAHVRVIQGSILPEHHHPHRQITNIISGELEMTVDGQTLICPAGTVITIPSNVPHSARAITDCHIIDVFLPVREDYRDM